MRNIFRKKNNEIRNTYKKSKSLIGFYCLFMFFLNCLPDKQKAHADLLMSLLLFSKDQNIQFANISAERIGIDAQVSSEVDIKILSYNLFMYHKGLFNSGNWGQEKRARLLVDSKYVKDQDVLVLEGVFDTKSKNILMSGLRSQYPNQIDVIGRATYGWNQTLGDFRAFPLDNDYNGGVIVLSKWPIEEKIQYIFENHGCGNDYYYNKGFVYVKINKHGRKYHIIGTDVQNTSCSDLGQNARKHQFVEIKNFINLKQVPKNETIFLAGSFNVNKGSTEYQDILMILGVDEPHYAGISFTWDPKKNAIASYTSGTNQVSSYLEYIFVVGTHFKPQVWQNLAYDPITPTTWNVVGYTGYEFSDRYPVYGFTYADSNTPTQSAHRRKYDQVSFESMSTGKKIQADPKQANGWLQVNASDETEFTKFNLLQEADPKSDTNCLKSGYTRIEPSYYLNYYWNWWLGGGKGNYAYYPKFNDASNNLQIHVLDEEECIKDGSRIVFKDYDGATLDYYYLTIWDGGNWDGYLYLWNKTYNLRETFKVRLNTKPERDWKDDLIYR
ncbi:sphingomyelin phosphodiesterase-like hemolysin SphH [Leptospira interrogans]|uniref:sphingomyelin phosphodiesterase-like hemolysin SphH n=1 Tax=Leptospira interrogans TaxID=173 RepID=UPI0007743B87|nr:sphingomyelin phosphodiesterase-like hemolysin SphH [Leptospira interrogans]